MAAIACVPAFATAQEWTARIGGTARGEYTDNYFFNAEEPQSAFTLSVTPSLVAVRRTPTSDVTMLLTLGGNKVWGLDDSLDYLSTRAEIGGTLRQERSRWSGNAGFSRAPSLQEVFSGDAIVYTLAQSNSAYASGSYSHDLTERWSVEARVAGNDNRYDSLQADESFQDNRSYSAGASARYAYSERAYATFLADFARFSSDIERTETVTAVLGFAYDVSPRLKLSGSAGYFWSEVRNSQIPDRDSRRDDGHLVGGEVSYDASQSSRLVAGLSERLTPSAAGGLAITDYAYAGLSYAVTDRLSGRLGASYTRMRFVGGVGVPTGDTHYDAAISVTYRIAQRWTLDAGYQYRRGRYPQELGEPRSNAAYVTLAYNWSDVPFAILGGGRVGTQGLPGAGALPAPAGAVTSGEPSGSSAMDTPLFDRPALP
jgi:hypothetical protein